MIESRCAANWRAVATAGLLLERFGFAEMANDRCPHSNHGKATASTIPDSHRKRLAGPRLFFGPPLLLFSQSLGLFQGTLPLGFLLLPSGPPARAPRRPGAPRSPAESPSPTRNLHVSPRPGRGRLFFSPVERQLQFGVAPQARLARRVQLRRVGQAAVHLRRLGLLIRPRLSRSHTRIRLSCEMSITVSASSASPAGGIRKERLGLRNTSITSVTSAAVASARAHNVPRVVGRRTPRGSVALSVSALKSFSQICCCRVASSVRHRPARHADPAHGPWCRWPRNAAGPAALCHRPRAASAPRCGSGRAAGSTAGPGCRRRR